MIRQTISDILGMRVREGQWVGFAEALNVEGRPDRATLIKMVMAMCQTIERLEQQNDDQNVKIERLEGAIKEVGSPFTPVNRVGFGEKPIQEAIDAFAGVPPKKEPSHATGSKSKSKESV